MENSLYSCAKNNDVYLINLLLENNLVDPLTLNKVTSKYLDRDETSICLNKNIVNPDVIKLFIKYGSNIPLSLEKITNLPDDLFETYFYNCRYEINNSSIFKI